MRRKPDGNVIGGYHLKEEALVAREGRRKTPEEKRAVKQKAVGAVSKICFLACAVFSVAAIAAIALFLVAKSVPGIAEVGLFRFLFGTTWKPGKEQFGILPMILGTVYVTAGAILIGGLFGIFTAVFIAKFCPRRLKKVIKQAVNLLAGLPSVIYGFFGLVVLIPLIRKAALGMGIDSARVNGSGILASSLVLGIMVLPTIITLTVSSVESQPKAYHEGALALGATKEQSVFKVLLPASKSGILAGIVLGIGRAMGETMAVILVCGNSAVMPSGLITNMRTLTSNIALEMSYAGELHKTMLIATGLVLFVFILLLTLSVNLLRRKKK